MRTIVTVPLVLVAFLPALAEPPGLDLPDSPDLQRTVSLGFEQTPVSQVLTVLFRVTLLPVEVDPCVTGEVSIELRNVTVEEALRALARMADFTVTWNAEYRRFQVTCLAPNAPGPPPVYRDPGSATITLHFLLEREDRRHGRQVFARPTLAVAMGQPAEIAIGIGPAPVYDLDNEGMPYTRTSLPSVRLKAYVAPAPQPYPQELRGILEIATDNEQAQSTTRTASRAFVVELPPDDTPVEVTRLRLSGKTYILSVEGRSP